MTGHAGPYYAGVSETSDSANLSSYARESARQKEFSFESSKISHWPPISCSRGLMLEIARAQAAAGTKGDRGKAEQIAKAALDAHTKKKNYPEAERLWLEVAEADGSWWSPFYQLGCVAALSGKPKDAMAYLKLALKANPDPKMHGWLRTDPDLQSIRSLPEFQALLADDGSGLNLAMLRRSFSGATSLPPTFKPKEPTAYQTTGADTIDLAQESHFKMMKVGSSLVFAGTYRVIGNSRLQFNFKDVYACEGCPPEAKPDISKNPMRTATAAVTYLDQKYLCLSVAASGEDRYFQKGKKYCYDADPQP